jgi:hypothetical protein
MRVPEEKKMSNGDEKITTIIRCKKQSDKISRLFEYFQTIKDDELTGYIKVNFNQGNICKVEKYEEILRK